MVLNELGQKISNALAMVNNAETIDEKVRFAAWDTLTDHPPKLGLKQNLMLLEASAYILPAIESIASRS